MNSHAFSTRPWYRLQCQKPAITASGHCMTTTLSATQIVANQGQLTPLTPLTVTAAVTVKNVKGRRAVIVAIAAFFSELTAVSPLLSTSKLCW